MRPTRYIIWLICWAVGAIATQPANQAATQPAASRPDASELPPLPKPEVTYFRELLALGPTELDRALAAIPDPGRNKLRSKLQEYAGLAPDEREARLRATELQWYLTPMMRTPPTNRVAQLAIVPDECRLLVQERLKQWDALTPEIQQEIARNEWMLRSFLQYRSLAASERARILSGFSPELRQRLEKQLDGWRALPAGKRQRMYDRFEQYFELPATEKKKTLGALSDAERRDMENTLRAFEQLPREQRRVCINSFRKFANMTRDECVQFLKNAERWKAIPPADRETWRGLVTKLPPLPPPPGEPPIPGPQDKNTGSTTPSVRGQQINPTNAGQ
jgi:Protein of unknown function (DUF3106)